MPSPGETFVAKFEDLWSQCDGYPIPPDEMLDLIEECGHDGVREGMGNSPWILHRLLSWTYDDDDPMDVKVIDTLLDICPGAASVPVPAEKVYGREDPEVEIYPLHAACHNSETQNAVIELLLKKNAQGLDHMVAFMMGIIEGRGVDTCVAGTPLHYYLYWGRGHIDIVKRLVEAYPGALTMKDATIIGLTPLHTVLHGPSKPDLETVRFLVQSNPAALHIRDNFGQYPIHDAICNEYIPADVMEFLLGLYTNIFQLLDYDGECPLHRLLRCGTMAEAKAVAVLQLVLRTSPDNSFFREADDDWGILPIRYAASCGHGPTFCKMLVELAPGCERTRDTSGALPIHGASHIGTVKLLVGLYPESIYLTYSGGITPFYYAVHQLDAHSRYDIVRYFLELDPSFASNAVAIPRHDGRVENLLPLHTACIKWGDNALRGNVEVVRLLFDYHATAILVPDSEGKLPVDLAKDALAQEKEKKVSCKQYEEIISFLETQQNFVANVSDYDALHTPDGNGLLLLHRALLEKGISLGAIKMIVYWTSRASIDRGPNPLHIACSNSSLNIVEYLVGVYEGLVHGVDEEGNNILHLACKGGNCKTVKYILERHASFAFEANRMNLLPIHVMCDGSGKEHLMESEKYCYERSKRAKEYLDTIWQLLLSYPAAVSLDGNSAN